ncbi:MAG: mechanosensitive ion channel family protein [Pseudomonadota bacterium]
MAPSRIAETQTWPSLSLKPILQVLLTVLMLGFAMQTAGAQGVLPLLGGETKQAETGDPSPNDVKELMRLLSEPKMVEWLKKAAEEDKAAEEENVSIREQIQEGLAHVRQRIAELVRAWRDLPLIPGALAKLWFDSVSPGESLRSLSYVLIFIFVGAGLEWLYWQSFTPRLIRLQMETHATLGPRLASASRRAGLIGGGLLLFALGSIGAFLAFDWIPFVYRLVMNLLIAVIMIRLLITIDLFTFAPRVPELRLVPLETPVARSLFNWIAIVATVLIFGLVISDTVDSFVTTHMGDLTAQSASIAVSVLMAVVIALVFILAIWRVHASVKREPGSSTTIVAPTLLSIVVVVSLFLWIIGSDELMLSAIIITLVLPTSAMISKLITHLFDQAEGEDIRPAEPEEDGDISAADIAPEDELEPRGPGEAGRYDLWRPVSIRLARIVLFVVAVLMVGGAWGINVLTLSSAPTTMGRIFGALIDVSVVILLADLVWTVARTAIDRRMAEIGDFSDQMGGEGGGAAGPEARMATLLPLMRKVLMVTVILMVGLSILYSFGINIGPLLAGAGIIGIAVGFGAQALVRDIVSGVFFLLDDAFRVGEYIEMESLRGTVESMSLRSLRVRHHRGAVHTIPFGELKSLTNYSRDWVIMKLEFRVPFETDLKLVKKLVKQVNAEMQENEMYGHHFIQPLKSQGVRRMEEFNMVVGVKFMCTPGEQWLIRRDAYQKIRDAFDANGISFATRNVKVEVVGDGPLSDEAKEAIAGAAQEAAEGPAVPPGPPPDEP